MGYDCEARYLECSDPAYPRNFAIHAPDGMQKLRLAARASDDRLARHTRHPEEMRIFLVACHQASVSIETMSNYLGLDADIIRTELLLGIAAWNTTQRRTNDAAFKSGLRLTASCD
jgi:hypothetical protein